MLKPFLMLKPGPGLLFVIGLAISDASFVDTIAC